MKITKKIENNLFFLGLVCIGLLFSTALYVQSVSVLETDYSLTTTSTNSITLSIYSQADNTTSTQNATTTFATVGVDLISLNIQFTGSSTDSTLNWRYEFSDDFQEWFGEDLIQASTTSIAHSSTTVAHSWNPQTTSKVRKSVSIDPIASRFMRVIFFTTNSTSSVWFRVALKSELNR